jgi:hypothetical protein
MKNISEIFINRPDLRYIAVMFIPDIPRPTTILGDGLTKGRLWIKACYMKTQGSAKELTPNNAKLESKASWSIAGEYNM